MKNDQVAIVTGSSRGIGRAIALALAKEGWSIVINYHNDHKAALKVQQSIQNLGTQSKIIQADLSVSIQRKRLVENALAYFSRIDLLINNAGVAPIRRMDMLQLTEESYEHVMDTNLKGPFFLTQRVAIEMISLIKSGVIENPKIVNIGSISAYTSSTKRAEYCLSKAGVGMMTSLWADRLAEFGIHVFEIRPGVIQTDMTAAVSDHYDRLLLEEGLTPIARWGKPEDVAKAVLAIAEDLLPFSTGEIINVDGGFHLRRL
jgi:NAD(P)-dependent dehydrogenase (short-subunit alcohol dehydrogenase family)